MGLVKLVLESQTKRNVQRLTQTYLTLGLQDIAHSVGLPSAAAAELVILRCAHTRLPELEPLINSKCPLPPFAD